MADECKVCGFSASREPTFPSETPSHSLPPRIQELLSSNISPSEAEEFHLRGILSQGDHFLQNLDDRIAAMQRELKELVLERARKAAELRDCKLILNPVRRVPKELLCEIFLSFINENLEEDETKSSLDPSATHWAVTRVCREWRGIAVSLPRMWSTMRIVQEDLDGPTGDMMTLQILGTQLHRSGTHQLSASFSCDDLVPSHHVLQTLLCTSQRWKDLHISVPVEQLAAFTSLRGYIPSLQTLHLWDCLADPVGPASTALRMDMFEFASNLKTLFGHPNALSNFKLPFSQITAFESTYDCPCHSYPNVLVLMPNLEKLTTTCSDPDDIDDYPDTIQLPNLRHAVLNRGDEQDPHCNSDCVLLCRLCLPALQDLEVTIYQSTTELRSLIERSQSPLVRLSLRAHDIDEEEDFVAILDRLPSLTSFKLSCSDAQFATKIIQTLIQNPSITPGLLSLEIDLGIDPEQLETLKSARSLLSVVEGGA
ncbi:hypothetical protein C8J56DRAFT_1163615 [Mycena floridula]|nr:hypothetical protein C8J56DRAFT_1163615 [Mycena floridula]